MSRERTWVGRSPAWLARITDDAPPRRRQGVRVGAELMVPQAATPVFQVLQATFHTPPAPLADSMPRDVPRVITGSP